MTDQTPRTEALEDALWKVIWEAAVIGSSQGRLSPETWQKAKDVLAQARTEALREAAERVRALVRYQFVAANGEFISLDDLWAILAGETE